MVSPHPYSRLFAGIALLLIASGWLNPGVGSAEEGASNPGVASGLTVQTESDYVTDPRRWGKLIFEPAAIRSQGGSPEDVQNLASLIGRYQRAWLARDSDGMQTLLDPGIVRFRQGTLRSGRDEVMKRIEDESRGERPEGEAGSTQLSIRDVDLRIVGDTAIAFYRVDTHTGARWEYADLLTVFQAFRKQEGQWRLLHHVETTNLDDPNAPDLPDEVPSRRAPFVLDFVYPVKNLDRAKAFYVRFLGEPEHSDAHRAIFRLRSSRFVLEAQPPDERIVVKKGAGNGYGIISVLDVESVREALVAAGALRVDEAKVCGPDLCVIAEDPSGNLVVFRERRAEVSPDPVRPGLSYEDADAVPAPVRDLLSAWVSTQAQPILDHTDEEALWVDDFIVGIPLGVAAGRPQIAKALEDRWKKLDRGSDGVAADLEISEVQRLPFGEREIIYFNLTVRYRGAHPSTEKVFVTQVWKPVEGVSRLESSLFMERRQLTPEPVTSMDYTAYPLHDLGRDGLFYKKVLGSEPYRDANWFGFWSKTSVFGMFEKDSEETPFRPYPHRSNGYADLNIRSAEEVLGILAEEGSPLPHVPGINNQVGIDPNPGYRQILAEDPEGNLINFSEYLEY